MQPRIVTVLANGCTQAKYRKYCQQDLMLRKREV